MTLSRGVWAFVPGPPDRVLATNWGDPAVASDSKPVTLWDVMVSIIPDTLQEALQATE